MKPVTATEVGALFGLVPAVFTFGLSIPIGTHDRPALVFLARFSLLAKLPKGAAVGGSTGLLVGGAARC